MLRLRAQGLAEYALILALIALAVLATLAIFGKQIENIFNQIGKKI